MSTVSEYSPKSSETVGIENDLQYSEVWPWSADMRRHLTLEYSVPKKDMWAEMARAIVDSGAERVIEYGSSSGYIIRQMLKQGFEGEVIGIDKENSYLWAVEESLRNEFPNSKAKVKLLKGDAQNVTLEELGDEPFDAGIAANILYHVPYPRMVFQSINKAVRDGGLQIFSTKDVEHQSELWILANQAAVRLGCHPIQSFYWHFQSSQMKDSLRESKRFTIDKDSGGEHVGETHIPNTEEGWEDLKAAVMSLTGIMKHKITEQPPEAHRLEEILESREIKDYLFRRQAAKHGGYFNGTVDMTWVACRNNRSS